MADVGTLIVNLFTNAQAFKKGMDDAKKKIDSFGSSTASFVKEHKLAIAAALTAVGAFAVQSIKAYGESEQATSRLTQALKNQGITSTEVRDDILAHAAALQKLSTFEDETIVAAQTTLISYGLQGEALKSATKAALDFAAATGRDLKDAIGVIGQGMNGQGRELKKYGLELNESATRTENLATVTQFLNDKFGGQAIAQRNTVLGQWAGMKNAFNDLQEAIGSFMAGPGGGVLVWTTSMITKLTEAITSIRGFATEVGGLGNLLMKNFVLVIGSVIQAFFELVTAIPGASLIMKQFGVSVADVNRLVEEQALKFQGMADKAMTSAGVVFTAEEKKKAAIVSTGIVTEEVAEETKSVNQDASNTMLAEYALNIQERAKMEKEFADYFVVTQTDWVNVAMISARQVVDGFGTGMADMIMEGKKFGDVMKSMWQDLARSVIEEISKIIAKQLILMALTGGASGGGGFVKKLLGGFAQGGIIGEPSVLTGLRTGESRMVGEAGPEAVVPMKGRNMTAREAGLDFNGGGNSGGGVDIVINIQGQFIEGSPSKWQELVREMIVPEIQRWSMSYPGGPFNRRRGAAA